MQRLFAKMVTDREKIFLIPIVTSFLSTEYTRYCAELSYKKKKKGEEKYICIVCVHMFLS